jgi:hypothetical protein
MTRYGTPYFVSMASARRYYAWQGLTPTDVARKLDAAEIYIGPPDLAPGLHLVVIDQGTRYAIEED